MQQVPNKQLVNFSPWAYFLGLGFAIGFGSIGTLLNVLFLHNFVLSYSVGAIVGLLLGLLGVKLFGAQWIAQIEKQQTARTSKPVAKGVLPLGFYIGTGAAIGIGTLGVPLGIGLHNVGFGLSISLAIGLVVGVVVGQIVKMTRK